MPFSEFKSPDGAAWLDDWNAHVCARSSTRWTRLTLPLKSGRTVIHAANADRTELPAVLILPGFRTSGMLWDLNDSMALLAERFRVFLVDVIGQPSLSTGESPPIRGPGYGAWLLELTDALDLKQVDIAGASFGGLLAFKLAAAAPGRIRRAVLMATAGIDGPSLHPRTMYYNLLPILRPSEANVRSFLENVVFSRTHSLPPGAYALLVEYQLTVLRTFKARAQFPYKLSRAELAPLTAPTWLILGANDPLFPHDRTARRARADLPSLREITVLPDHGHGVETSRVAIERLRDILTAP